MSIKTILVCLNEVERVKVLLDLASAIAAKHDAHVTGLYVIPAVRVYAASDLQLTAQVFEGQRTFFKERAEKVKAAFEAMASRQRIQAEWQLVESPSPLVADPAAERALQADLVIVSQIDPDSEAGVELDFVERMIMGTGRPLLVVPREGTFGDVGRRVVIGWNATREASRAAFDAVPLLKEAEAVHVTWVDPQKSLEENGALPGAELAQALSRHGISAIAEGYPTSGLTSGEALLNRVSDVGADLLVMGAYGHSRLRELVLGGATRFVLQSMTVPVLMSH